MCYPLVRCLVRRYSNRIKFRVANTRHLNKGSCFYNPEQDNWLLLLYTKEIAMKIGNYSLQSEPIIKGCCKKCKVGDLYFFLPRALTAPTRGCKLMRLQEYQLHPLQVGLMYLLLFAVVQRKSQKSLKYGKQFELLVHLND